MGIVSESQGGKTTSFNAMESYSDYYGMNNNHNDSPSRVKTVTSHGTHVVNHPEIVAVVKKLSRKEPGQPRSSPKKIHEEERKVKILVIVGSAAAAVRSMG